MIVPWAAVDWKAPGPVFAGVPPFLILVLILVVVSASLTIALLFVDHLLRPRSISFPVGYFANFARVLVASSIQLVEFQPIGRSPCDYLRFLRQNGCAVVALVRRLCVRPGEWHPPSLWVYDVCLAEGLVSTPFCVCLHWIGLTKRVAW